MFDVNLRQHYFSAELLRTSLEAANAVKLNEDELPVLVRLFSLEGSFSAVFPDLSPFNDFDREEKLF